MADRLTSYAEVMTLTGNVVPSGTDHLTSLREVQGVLGLALTGSAAADRLTPIADVQTLIASVTPGSDTTTPTTPTGVFGSGATATAFTANWTGSTDAVGVTGYEVQVDGTAVATTDGTARSAPITGLTPATTYSLRVRARDAAGNYSALSTAASINTASVPPAYGTSTTATNSGTSLTWTHTVPTGANRVALVAVGIATGGTSPVTGVTVGGTSGTRVGSAVAAAAGGITRIVDLWSVPSAPSGAQSVVVSTNFATAQTITGVVTSITGVGSVRTAGTAISTTAVTSLSMATSGGTATDLIYSAVFPRSTVAATPEAGLTQRFSITGSTNAILVGSTQPGAASSTSNYTWTTADIAAGIAVALAPITASTPAPPTSAVSAPTLPTGSPAGTWAVAFTDNFDTGTTADNTRWRRNRFGGTATDDPFNKDLENAALAPSQVSVSDGQLHFTVAAQQNTLGAYSYDYISGTVSSEGRFNFAPGSFVEARITVPKGSGLWPAFWACVSGTYPPEIDIFEYFNTATQQRPQFNLHPVPSGQTGPAAYGVSETDYTGSPHTYGLEYALDGKLTPYLDGVAYPGVSETDPSGLSYFIILNLSVYRNTTPPIGAQMDTDYVRVWTYSAPTSSGFGSNFGASFGS